MKTNAIFKDAYGTGFIPPSPNARHVFSNSRRLAWTTCIRITTGLAACAIAACSTNSAPDKWTLWYIPNEPKVVVPFTKECHTFVFANVPDAKTFRVAVVRRVNGSPEDHAFFHSGDAFSGPMELGAFTVRDDSTGYDIAVDSVYRVDAYVAAKARADADCPQPVKTAPAPRPVPRPSVSPH